MSSRRGRLLLLSGSAALVLLAARLLRGGPAPAFDATTREPVAWPDLPPLPLLAEPGELAHEVEPVPPSEPDPRLGEDSAWSEPAGDGSCPDGFPVKAKLASGIFHLPGGASYQRTTPDRCYADQVAAEAAGLRRAKR